MNYKVSVIVPAYNEEKYLSDALNSLISQTFDDFEVIIINDGSTDNTQKIIDEYCKKYHNFRGIYQENSGVAAARNKGIKESRGEYVAFLDGDDLYDPNALKNLYKTAMRSGAELVIGRMRIINVFGSVTYVGPVNLSKKRCIDPFDKELIWTGAMWNKLFSRKKLLETGILVPNLKYDEDCVFIMNFALKCKKIAGCPHDIVLYRKRPFWEGYSVTQTINVEYIKDHLKAYEIIEDNVKKAFQEKIDYAENIKIKNELSKKYNEYLDELCHRRLAILCMEFYRFFWKADVESLELINKSVNEIKKCISPESWAEDIKKFNELQNFIHDKKEMSDNPFVTIVIDHKTVELSELNFLLGSIYSQDFPAFEIIVPYAFSKLISNDLLNNENLKLLNTKKNFKNQALKVAKGNSIIFIEDKIFFEPGAIRYMYNQLQSPELDFVSMKIHQLKDNELKEYPHQELAYSYKNTAKNSVKSKFNYLDLYLSNKLIKTDFLKQNKFKFSRYSSDDTLKLYNISKFKKLPQKYILSVENEKSLLKSLKSRNKYLSIKLSALIQSKKPVYEIIKFRRSAQIKLNHTKKLRQGYFKSRKESSFKNSFQIKFNSIKKNGIKSEANYIKLLKRLPLKNRVFFCSIRVDDKLLENMSLIYDELDTNKVFISKKHPHSKKTRRKILYYLLTSKVIVIDGYLGYLSLVKLKKEQKVVQIWHACGAFKKFGLDCAYANYKIESKFHKQYDDVIVSSENVRKHYASAFGIPIDKIKPLGVPRTDIFLNENNKKDRINELYKQFPQLKDKKIILYSPTFREDDENRVIPLNTKINWKMLSESLNDDELFLINKHPAMEEDLLEGQEYGNIIDLSNISTYSLMLASTIMITDYSSVIFEYSLLDKPMIFYCPDINEYPRDFYLKYPKDLPGKLVCDSEELIKEIHSINSDIYDLEDFKNKEMGACDGNSTERIVKLIKDYLS